MSHHFFLSYARADSNPLVKKFFEDLCDTIRIASGLPRSQVVGFCEEPENQLRSDWSSGSAEGLQSSRLMVCLLSRAYFHSERCGKEWQLFEMRRSQSVERGTSQGGFAQIIMPVSWTGFEGPVPKVISDLLAHPDRVHQSYPLRTMFKSSSKLLGEYADFVKTLAYRIMAIVETTTLPPLDSLPPMNQVHSAFLLWDHPATNSAERKIHSPGPETLATDPDLMRSLAAQVFELVQSAATAPSPSPRATDHGLNIPPQPSATTDQYQTNNYKVEIIDGDPDVPNLLRKILESTDFEVRFHTQAETVATKIILEYSRMKGPDLFIIGLRLDGEMQGLELIRKLKTHNIPSSIIALSSTPLDLSEPMRLGAAGVTKPFEPDELKEKIRLLADVGRKTRLYRLGSASPEADPTRRHRPVFLSYRGVDKETATGLRCQIETRGIGVWYAEDAVLPGDKWQRLAKDGIARASIFLPLITENYAESDNCLGEIDGFSDRLINEDSGTPLLLPLVYGSLDVIRRHERIRNIVDERKYIDLTGNQFVPGLNQLLDHIEARVRPSNGSHEDYNR